MRALVTVPFVLPTVVVGAAFSRILPHRFDHTVWAILIAHVFFNYAVVVRVVGGLWANLDPRLAESASVLGAPRWRSMLEIDLPLLAPAIAATAAIVFLFTFTSFGVVLLLGGPRHSTLEVEIYRQTAELLDLQVAAALALVQLVAVVALLLVTTRMQSRLAVQRRMRRRDETTITVRTRGQRRAPRSQLRRDARAPRAPVAARSSNDRSRFPADTASRGIASSDRRARVASSCLRPRRSGTRWCSR